MLERLVNEDREGAEALFHEIVVEKSRDIYQSILESEDEDLDETEDEDLDEASDDDELEEAEDEDLDEDEDENLEEMFGLDEFEMEADPMGGDATDDMIGDLGMDDEEGDMDMDADDEMDGDVEDRVQDLEDALEELKAEFDAMMGDEEGEGDEDMDMDMGDEEGDMDMDIDSEEDDETEEAFAFESDDEEVDESEDEDLEEAKKMKKDDKKSKKTAGEEMREYVEKVSGGGLDAQKIGGDNGTNTKSIVASKNDMGGTTQNILRTDTEQGVEAAKGQIKGSSLHKHGKKEDNAGNINVPGGKAGKTSFKKTEPGHGAERKGKPETADKGAHSTIRTTVRSK